MLFTFVSGGSTEILGFTPQEWLAAPAFWADHIHADDRERVIAQFVRAATAGWSFDTQYRFLAKDGSVVWLRDLGHVVRDVEGRPTLVRGLMVDITKQKLVEEERRSRRGTVPDRGRAPAGDRLPGGGRGRTDRDPSTPVREPPARIDPGVHPGRVDGRSRRALAAVRSRGHGAHPRRVPARGASGAALQRRVPDDHQGRLDGLVPRRGGVGPRRAWPADLLAGDHVRRHPAARERAARAGDRDALPGAGGAAPGHRLLRVRQRRRAGPHLHQRPRHRDPGRVARGVAGRPGHLLAGSYPPRRPRHGERPERPDRSDRRAVLGGVPDVRRRRATRVDPRRSRAGPRRRGQPQVLAGRDERHHRAQGGGGAALGGRGSVPSAGGADARHHLPRLGRTAVHALHEPAIDDDPGLHAAGLVRRRRPVRQAGPPRRRRARDPRSGVGGRARRHVSPDRQGRAQSCGSTTRRG